MGQSKVILKEDPGENQYVLRVIDNSETYGPTIRNIFFKYDNTSKSRVLENARGYKEGIGGDLGAVIEDHVLPLLQEKNA
ncbi:hypothetical protein A3K73_06930 [Candidatus Pacearchaeota archaeon RBG_13_36_9]|nr:MAG: hypothetical protein A3K73_06930 [Candidatus Pacearchaeota archaeon RBG_13_36_9]